LVGFEDNEVVFGVERRVTHSNLSEGNKMIFSHVNPWLGQASR